MCLCLGGLQLLGCGHVKRTACTWKATAFCNAAYWRAIRFLAKLLQASAGRQDTHSTVLTKRQQAVRMHVVPLPTVPLFHESNSSASAPTVELSSLVLQYGNELAKALDVASVRAFYVDIQKKAVLSTSLLKIKLGTAYDTVHSFRGRRGRTYGFPKCCGAKER